jgi:SCP-2 sterol transfer family
VRRCLNVKLLPDRRCTIQFLYRDLSPPRQSWWLVVDGGTVDVCNFDPGHELDLLVKSSLRSMTAIWMGLTTIKKEAESGDLELEGDPSLARSMQLWLGLSAFASQPRRAP